MGVVFRSFLLHFRFYADYFSHCCAASTQRARVQRERLVFGFTFERILLGLEKEAAGYIVSTVRKQRVMDAGALLSFSVLFSPGRKPGSEASLWNRVVVPLHLKHSESFFHPMVCFPGDSQPQSSR